MFNPRSPRHYFTVGWQGLLLVEMGLQKLNHPTPSRILDLPCGYGRVTRFLRARYPDAEIVAAEIDPAAAQFCASSHGARPLLCDNPLSKVDLLGEYDVIFSGSLFTHFPMALWDDALPHLAQSLKPTGVLIVTAHGDFAARILAGEPLALSQAGHLTAGYGVPPDEREAVLDAYHADGFAFGLYPGGHEAYGVSLSRSEWVNATLTKAGLRTIDHLERGWDAHQDVYFCVGSEATS